MVRSLARLSESERRITARVPYRAVYEEPLL